jgi:hypothetical protein
MVLQEVMKMIQSVALVSGMMVVALVGYRGSVPAALKLTRPPL